jgi:hypothetical protein
LNACSTDAFATTSMAVCRRVFETAGCSPRRQLTCGDQRRLPLVNELVAPQLVPAGRQGVTTFRIGSPEVAPSLAPRRPAEEVFSA